MLGCLLDIPAMMLRRQVDCVSGNRGECWEVMEWKVRALRLPRSRK